MTRTPPPAPDLGDGQPAPGRRAGDRGQGMVEYAFILMLIAIAVLVAVQVLGTATSDLYSNIHNGLTVATGH